MVLVNISFPRVLMQDSWLMTGMLASMTTSEGGPSDCIKNINTFFCIFFLQINSNVHLYIFTFLHFFMERENVRYIYWRDGNFLHLTWVPHPYKTSFILLQDNYISWKPAELFIWVSVTIGVMFSMYKLLFYLSTEELPLICAVFSSLYSGKKAFFLPLFLINTHHPHIKY